MIGIEGMFELLTVVWLFGMVTTFRALSKLRVKIEEIASELNTLKCEVHNA